MNKFTRISQLFIASIGCLVIVQVAHAPKANANHYPNWIASCPLTAAEPLQTGIISGFEAGGLRYYSGLNYTITQGATSSFTVPYYGEAAVCPNAGYSQSTNVRSIPSGINPRLTVPTLNYGTISKYPVVNHASGTITVNTSGIGLGFNNLCFTSTGYATFPHLGNITLTTPSQTLCIGVQVNAPAPIEQGECTVIISSSNLTPGQSFTASFTVKNTGNGSWSVDPTVAARYRLGTTNPNDTLQWGGSGNRLDIPGYSSGFGLVLGPGQSTPTGSTIPTTFTRTFTAPLAPGSYTFGWRVINGSGAGVSGAFCSKPITVIPPATVSCSPPSSVFGEVNVPFNVTLGFTVNGGLSGSSMSYSTVLTAPPQINGYTNPVNTGTVTLTGGSVSGSPPAVSINGTTAGSYSPTYRVTLSNGAFIDCLFTVNIGTRPFFIVRNGDVTAGIPIAGCTGWGAGIASPVLTSWNQVTNPNVGAGTNLATFSRGLINGVASAQNRTNPSPPIGLSFANTILFGSLFGGSLADGIIPCPTDYYDTLKNVTASPIVSTIDVAAIVAAIGTNPAWYSNGSLTITTFSPLPIPLGKRPIIYVNGDAYITAGTGSIKLSSGATTIEDMPNFYLVVKGNIYISRNITRLDGVYIAQPDSLGNRGVIYTCSNSTVNGPPSVADLNDAVTGCKKNTLTVNGAFIAKELKLYRSIGTLSANNPAEIFNATPATWLATPCAISDSCTPGGKPGVDAITSLPPIL